MSDEKKTQFEAVSEFAAKAEETKTQCRVTSIAVAVDARSIIENAVSQWGRIVGDFRAAPNWANIDDHLKTLSNKEAFAISWAVDENGKGVVAYGPKFEADMALDAIWKVVEQGGVSAAIPDDKMVAAANAYSSAVSFLKGAIPFEGGAAASVEKAFDTMSAKKGDTVRLEGYGTIDSEQFDELKSFQPQKPLTEEEAKAAAANAPQKKKYSSLGQIVKAGDAATLDEWVSGIVTNKAKSTMSEEETQDMFDKLLWHSFRGGHNDCAKVLLDKGGATLSFGDEDGVTCLLAAAMSNNPDTIDTAIAAGASLSETDCDGRTPAMLAADADAEKCLTRLFELGVDPDEQSLDGLCAMHIAAAKGSKKAMDVLIASRANPTLEEMMDGAIPSQFVDQEDHPDMYDALEDYRSKWDEGKISKTPKP